MTGGLARTGRIVSTAAALLAVSFFAFATGHASFIQLFGLGTGLAILIDATLVRGVLVPAFMRALGEKSWYAPPFLRRLHHRIGISDTEPNEQQIGATPSDQLIGAQFYNADDDKVIYRKALRDA